MSFNVFDSTHTRVRGERAEEGHFNDLIADFGPLTVTMLDTSDKYTVVKTFVSKHLHTYIHEDPLNNRYIETHW